MRPVRIALMFVVLFLLGCAPSLMAQGGVTLSLSKSHDAPTPVPSGQQFTYTLIYNWSGGIPGTIFIRDTIPPELDVVSTIPAATVVGNIVTFAINDAATTTQTGGAGTVQINVKFKPGVTCNGTRACNKAYTYLEGPNFLPIVSNEVCATASAQNKWTIEKSLFAGCAVDNDVIFRICIMNPAGGDIGGLNLTNTQLTDILPAGAIVTSIPGYTYTQTGSSVTINTGLPSTLPVSPWNAWYCLYMHVTFPSPTFTTGQTVVNLATLRYNTPCDPRFTTMSDTARVTLCTATNTGSLWKNLSIGLYFPSNPFYYPSFSPGCCGTYTMAYSNTGNTAQSGFVMEDIVPSTLNVTSIVTNVPAGNTPVTMEVFCWTGSACGTTPCFTQTYSTAGSQTFTVPSGSNVCRIRWTYGGSIAVAQSVSNSINVCVRTASYAAPFTPVAVGQNIVNTVTAQATGLSLLTANHTKPVDSLRPKILASKFFIGACGTSCSPETAGPFVPGQTVRWRMAVSNVGNTNANPCTITDNLPAGLTYAGNEKYYYGSFNWLANQYAPPCCSLTTTVPTEVGGTITSPTVGASNLTWTFPVLPFRCDGTVDYFIIEFDVKISDAPPAPPGLYTNTFTFSAGNLTAPVASNPAYLTVNSIAQLTLEKTVRQKPSGTFATSAVAPAGSQVEYRLRVTNTGNLTLKDICLLDIMPHTSDINVLPPYNPRLSTYDIPLLSGGVVVPAGYSTGYNNAGTTKNPRRSLVCTGFCGVADPVGSIPGTFVTAPPTITYAFSVSGATTTTLAPGASLDILVTATIPSGVQPGNLACNNFGVRAVPVNQATACMSAQSNNACVRVADKPVEACQELWQKGTADSCCGYSLTLSNFLGSINSIQYNVLGGSGVVQSIQTAPCLPTSTSPTNLAGSTSGILNFNPTCTGANPLQFNIEAQSTTNSGEICIELLAVITGKNGQKIECRDTICFRCDPAPRTRCDSMSVKPFPFNDLDLSGRTFTVYNLKQPASPICSVKIVVAPPPSGPGVNGGGLYIDGIWKPWPFGTSVGYTQVLPVHGMPANTTVKFNLGIDYTIGWVGNVTVTAYHCDGDSCVSTYGPWKAEKGKVIGTGTPIDIPDKHKLRVHRLSFPPEKIKGLNIRAIALRHSDPVESIVAVTGSSFDCNTGEDEDCDGIFQSVQVRGRVTLAQLRRALDDNDDTDNTPEMTFLYTTSSDRQPTVEIIYYDENGQEVGHDNVTVTGTTLEVRDPQGITGALGSLTAHPNPTKGNCDVGFTLPSVSVIDLEILDLAGKRMASVISGERMPAGKHTRTVDMSTLPSGSYLVSLRVNGVPTTTRVELVK